MMPPRLSKQGKHLRKPTIWPVHEMRWKRSEEHTSELQSQSNLVCRLLLEKKTNMVKPAVVNVALSCIRTSPPHEYRCHIKMDGEDAQRLQSVTIAEPSTDDSLSF